MNGLTVSEARQYYGRFRAWSGCFVLLVTLLFAGCGSEAPVLPQLGPEDVVLAFGDSITYGTGAGNGASYPEVLSELIDRQVIAAGVPGERTAEGLERLPQELEAHRPRILLLCLGGNDMLRKVNVGETEANLRKMIEIARGEGVAVLLIGVPKPALIGGTADFYQRIVDDLDVAYEGQALNDILRDETYKADPVHPNAQGYRLLAQAVAEALRSAGAI